VLAEPPDVARLGARLAGRCVQGGVEVELLGPLPALAAVETFEQLCDLVLGEAGQRQIGRTR
jgi:hypothetical protein